MGLRREANLNTYAPHLCRPLRHFLDEISREPVARAHPLGLFRPARACFRVGKSFTGSQCAGTLELGHKISESATILDKAN